MEDKEKELWEQLNSLVQACRCFQKAEAWEAAYRKTRLSCDEFDKEVAKSEALLKQIPMPEK